MSGEEEWEGRILLEFTQIGHQVKATAIDPVTLTEVSITGPASAGQEALSRLALQKLRYMMAKKNGN